MPKVFLKAVSSSNGKTEYVTSSGVRYFGKDIGIMEGKECFAEVSGAQENDYSNTVIRIIDQNVPD